MKRSKLITAWAVVDQRGRIQRFADGIPGVSRGTLMIYTIRKDAVMQAHVMEDCRAVRLTGKVGKGRKRSC